MIIEINITIAVFTLPALPLQNVNKLFKINLRLPRDRFETSDDYEMCYINKASFS